MAIIYKFVVVIVPIFVAVCLPEKVAARRRGPHDKGKEDGKEAVIELWEDTYNEDCDKFEDFEDEATEQLIDGTYEEESGDNWRERSYKDGARSGVLSQIDDIEDECNSEWPSSENGSSDEGRDAVNKLWEDEYAEDCDDIFIFTQDAIETFLEGSEGGSFKEGAWQELIELQNQCLDESYCDDIGSDAASAIATKFCNAPRSASSKSGDPDIILICRDEAIDVCRDSVVTEVEKLADRSECKPIDNDEDNLSRGEKRDLKDKCTDKVKDYIEDADQFF